MSPRQVVLAALFAVVVYAELSSAIGIADQLSKPVLQSYHHHHAAAEHGSVAEPAPTTTPAVNSAQSTEAAATAATVSSSGWENENCVAILSAIFPKQAAAAPAHVTNSGGGAQSFHSTERRPTQWFTTVLSNTLELVKSFLATNSNKKSKPAANSMHAAPAVGGHNTKYMKFIPEHVATVHPGGPAVKFSGPCFTDGEFSMDALDANGRANVHVKLNKKKSWLCMEYFGVTNLRGCKLDYILLGGTHSYSWQLPGQLSGDEQFALMSNGFSLFRFPHDPFTIADHLLETGLMFVPLLEVKPDAWSVKRNLEFMRGDSVAALPERAVPAAKQAAIDELNGDFIESGDVVGLLRLDGLDPLLGWAMGGSTLGHMTIAMRDENDALFVCESTTDSKYWPTNGIQCTPFARWMTQVKAAGQNVVHMPLSPEVRAKFDNKVAWHFINQSLHLEYGFSTILASWLDGLSFNYPPPLSPELHLLLPTYFYLAGAEDIVNQIWTRSLLTRLGLPGQITPGVNIMSTLAALYRANLTLGQAVIKRERDGVLYEQTMTNGTRAMGRAMVCCVFVCSVLKESGAFGASAPFECEELTVPDLYQASIYDQHFKRPDACVAADPELPYCQLTGDYQIQLNDYNTHPIGQHTYAHCPRGTAPEWEKPENC